MQLSLAPLRSAFANRTFSAYLAAAGGADTGFWIAVVAQGWLVERLTHSTLWLGLVAAASQAPALVVSLLGGELADRFDRRALILGANVALGALSLLAAGLIARDRITVVLLLAIELLIGSVIALEHPVDRSFIYDLIEDDQVEEAIALSSAEFALARTGGPALGGVAIAALGVAAGYALNALFVLPVVAFRRSRWRAVSAPSASAPRRRGGELRRGLALSRARADDPCFCLLTAVFTIGVSPYVALLADVAKNALGLGERGYGLLQAASGSGALAGALALAAAGRTKRKGRIVTLAALAGGLLLALFACCASRSRRARRCSRSARSTRWCTRWSTAWSRSGSRRATGGGPTRSSRSRSWAAFRWATSCSARSRSGPARSRPCSSRGSPWRSARRRSGSG